ncbi:ATP-binding cassette domain-containing protein [Microvirga sp. ACRRW]|nr:ATP-binding cassette domain-containing protein [Microvirga sp. ACRRW]MCG7393632.1 ATP-binding cassette domain-containing protein [Microvirga sp. ACRRW]
MAGASLSIDGHTLLAPTSLSLRQGCVYGIIGHNGSGKSTLLKLLGRQAQPSSGTIRYAGTPLENYGARAFARHVAYLPQQTPATTGLTVRELVRFGRYPWHGPLGRISSEDHLKVVEAMQLAQLDDLADRLVDTLSGGERQRAWIAMLVAQDSSFILLDEPTSALDLAHQIEVLRLLRNLSRSRNLGVVAILHDINMAARFCDELIALQKGHIRIQGKPDDLMQSDVLEMVYGIPMEVIRHPASDAPIGFAR